MQLEKIDEIEQKLYQAAWNAREKAWAPYSGFRVGASLYLPDHNSVIVGVNVENASFGATICAERSAMMATISLYGKSSVGMVLVATDAVAPAVPCALCLQVLAEFCQPDMPILLANATGIVERLRFSDLLPRPFTVF
jgi:cytidine deaminase